MRITDTMVYDSMRNSVMDNQSRLFQVQQQIASNTKLVNLSDDPRGSEKAVQLKNNQAEMAQFKRNISSGASSIDVTTNALQGVNDLIVRAKELAVQLANGDLNASDRQAASSEVGEIMKQVVQYANTESGGEYIFSGFKSNQPAYTADGVWQGDTGQKFVRIGQSEKMAINETGLNIFGDRVTAGASPPAPPAAYVSGSSIVEDLAQFKASLDNNNVPGIQKAIDAMDASQQKVIQAQAEIGARSKHMDVTGTAIESMTITLAGQLSGIQDIDLAAASTEFNKQMVAYEAAIKVAATISTMSIVGKT